MEGKLFVIESGTDGSGKATQTKLLYDRLISDGYNVMKVEYPNYRSRSSELVKMYLDGDFGKKADDVNPYIASTFFAADRYASYKIEWEDFFRSGGIILADRYTTSNMVHQASKMDDDNDKEKFLTWLEDFEFNLYGLPKPNEVFFLDVPVEVTSELMKDRKNKYSDDVKKDIHESDLGYLKRTYVNSKYVAKKYDWSIIDCLKKTYVESDRDKEVISMKSIEEIHNIIYEKVVDAIRCSVK